MKSFEEYLQEIHSNQADGVLDDNMPDDFDNWLSELDTAEVMEYAESYGKELMENK